MFTGIIEERGIIRSLEMWGSSGQIKIQCKRVLEGTEIGDSIAVNGICLTVTNLQKDGFTADVMAETMRRSSLSSAVQGDSVNLERAMAANGRFGGHIVSGHIDGTGEIRNIQREENAVWYSIAAPRKILKYIIEKGSISIDGISLTVAYVDEEIFKVSIIPHTMQETTLAQRKVGATVNLENDIVGKYVERFLQAGSPGSCVGPVDRVDSETGESGKGYVGYDAAQGETSGITMEFLERYGF